MRLLFLHQNFPGQFRFLVNALAAEPGLELVALGEPEAINRAAQLCDTRLKRYAYKMPPPPARPPGPATVDGPGPHPYLSDVDTQVRRGHTVARALRQLERSAGFRPDAVIAHPGWGESLFVKDVHPDAKLLNYLEFYFAAYGADVNFDPEYPSTLDTACRLRMRNSVHLLALEAGDGAMTPTAWQRSRFPVLHQPRIDVVHEGVDTGQLVPDPNAVLEVDGLTLRPGDPVVTYVARNLEPYRGFHVFMRALPAVLRAHPTAQVVIVGGDDVSYGRRLQDGRTYRQELLDEVGAGLDLSRVHFTGKLPYDTYRRVLQVSAVHVYLTYPFVLSWSMLEAMSSGCLVLGSRTAPVQEVIEDGINGRLVDFFDRDALVRGMLDALNDPASQAPLRVAARDTVVQRYDRERVCLPAGLEVLRRVCGLPAAPARD